MPGSPKKRERRERWEAWKAQPEAFDELCEFIAEANGGIYTFAQQMDFAYGTLVDWCRDPARSDNIVGAREAAADWLADQMIAVSRDRSRDPQCRRAEIDALKWYAAKLAPKVYGDRIQQDISARVTIEDELLKLAAKGG